MDSFDIKGIDDFIDDIKTLNTNYKKEVKNFMKNEGNKLKKETVKTAKNYIDTKTGNYLKGIKRGTPQRNKGTNVDSISVYAGRPAFHSHLIEYGHKVVKPKTRTYENKKTGETKTIKFKDAGKTVGYAKGHLIYSTALDKFKGQYEADCKKFSEDIIKILE